jgi:ribosomal protein S27AE
MNDETCPKCGAHFPAERAWANRSVAALVVAPALQDLDTRVKCPSCGSVFPAVEFRFFGFVPPATMRAAVLGGAVIFFVLAAIFMFGAP